MRALLWMGALAAMLVASAVGAQAPATPEEMTDFAYSLRPGNSVYVTGKVGGKEVHMVRSGPMGSGKWAVYTGPLNNRVRLILDDRTGLREVLALDTGQRMALTQVGTERIEYRLYAAGRKFVIGSVLYRDNGRWLQGLMKTEEFKGYASLDDVADMTEKFKTQAARTSSTWTSWLQDRWDSVDIVPPAHAQNDAASVRRLLTVTEEFLDGPVAHEMMRGMLIGTAAFTAKLVEAGGGMPALLRLVGGGTGAAALLPVLEAVLVAIVAVEVARRTYQVGNRIVGRLLAGRNLGDTVASMFGGFSRPSQFEEVAPVAAASGSTADFEALRKMADRMDEDDRKALQNDLDLADKCTQRGDMQCTETALRDASKVARNVNDRKRIFAARERMDSRAAELRADADQAQRRAAEAEAARRRAATAAAERARQQQEEQAQSEVAQAILDAMLGGMRPNSTAPAFPSPAPSSRSANASPSSAAAPSATPGGQRWNEVRSIRELGSGRVSVHRRDISADVGSMMRSSADAQSQWGSQGGRVRSFSGCGTCGVGSTINIIMTYGSTEDTYVFRREK